MSEFIAKNPGLFAQYANFYDLFYSEKDYHSEVSLVLETLTSAAEPIDSVLDLGCGTGRHAIAFAERNYHVVGLDLSAAMVSIAQQRVRDSASKDRIKIEQHDVAKPRAVYTDKPFDLVVSLFHVASYLGNRDELLGFCKMAHSNLRSEGRFVFDFWFGEGVENSSLEERTKSFVFNGIRHFRMVRSRRLKENKVEVVIRFWKEGASESGVSRFEERHVMRYWFRGEIEEILASEGFDVEAFIDPKTKQSPTAQSWDSLVVAKKK